MKRAFIVIIAALGACNVLASAQTVIPLDPRATYLHTNNDPAQPAAIIELAAVGAAPGDFLRMRARGDWDCGGPCIDEANNTIAVFSNGPTLLASSEAHRVPGAIDAGVDMVSANTYYSGQPTDIPEDFWVTRTDGVVSEVRIRVPAGATHVFVGTHDSLYYDNTDPDSDFAVELTVICPGDYNLDGNVDFFDVQAFLGDFAAEVSTADYIADGLFDFFDVQSFLGAFAAGCP